jgi:hypothetical protein
MRRTKMKRRMEKRKRDLRDKLCKTGFFSGYLHGLIQREGVLQGQRTLSYTGKFKVGNEVSWLSQGVKYSYNNIGST